ncbi:hypothetical protein ACFYXH_10720 [Streptomyces sp. NPDC002730]|uniref:hypothetical protein n=1 Tax=Streptomyces sp. NPDC002730 TaxID=3364662 RepID=UPI003682D3E0
MRSVVVPSLGNLVCSPKALAIAIAAQLAAVTRQEPSTHETPHRIRIEVLLPEHLTHAGRRSVLAALAGADRFGHDLTSSGGVVWAEVDV